MPDAGLFFLAVLLAATATIINGQHRMERRIMTALDDLNAAEADEEAVLQALLTDHDAELAQLAALQAQLASQDNPAAADVEAIVTRMRAAQDAARAHIAPPADTQPAGQGS